MNENGGNERTRKGGKGIRRRRRGDDVQPS